MKHFEDVNAQIMQATERQNLLMAEMNRLEEAYQKTNPIRFIKRQQLFAQYLKAKGKHDQAMLDLITLMENHKDIVW